MSAGLKRNINNNVVDTTADRKWSPEVHTKIFIPPISVTEPRAKFAKEIGSTTAQQEPRRKYVTTVVCSSGSDSSDGGCAAGGGVGRGRRHPVSRSGSCRGQPQALSPMSAGALSPSLRSLGVPGSPSAAAMAIGSANHNSMCGSGGMYASATHQHRDASPLRSWSDAVSVRSLASIGMGSTDGRKLTIAKVPTSPAELLNLASPQTFIEKDDGDFTECSSCSRSLAESLSDFRSRTRTHYWRSKLQFILACLGCSVGLGNMWRFPYHCHKSGGGIFLIPYFLVMIFCGIPLLYLELAIGQFTKRGPISAISKLCPILKGVGLSSVVTSFFVSVYYNVIIAYTLYYFFSSIQDQPPWAHCNNRWNTDSCWMAGSNTTRPLDGRSPTEEFYNLKMLKIAKDPNTLGNVRWELAVCMFVVSTVVYFKLWKSTESSGRVLHLTATLPFAMLAVLLVRSLMLDGADIGIEYFLFKLRWELLLDSKVWVSAVGQNLSSIGIAFGLVISFSSYNRYNNNIMVDTVTISLINGVSSFAVGLFTFATLGSMAKEYGKSVEDVIPDGPGIVFILFTKVLSSMPYSTYLSMLLFFMMFCLALNSEFAIVEVIVTSIQDGFPRAVKKYLICHELLVLVVCFASFLLGLPLVTQGGTYLFQIIDYYTSTWSVIYIAFFEVIAVSWMYGGNKMVEDIERITGTKPLWFFKFSWYITTPLLLMFVWAFSLTDYEPPTYMNGTRSFPTWVHVIGWSMVMISLACIPIMSVYTFLHSEGMTFYQKLNRSIKPRSNEFGELPIASKDNLKEMATLIECKAPQIPPIIVFPETVKNSKI
ncbi:sodium- and chloride-dependent GABA transporter ine-like isoform X1 [Myzus persicae]|uniref:sodium- and chloride-dependent GABA transporter ine-like isoform X1 n=1 Tax=Myzus persicae TaxID=13164 RepID=UPI000B9304CD|nr:sodium- and chloride-dependent GABA transporter ine-like isoform X1 [Myzus persicae]